MENEMNASTPVESESPSLSIDDAVRAMHTDETDKPEQADKSSEGEQASEAITDAEPDDFALVEGEEEAEGKDGEETEAEPLLANPDMVIEIDGNKVPVRELMDGYLREADYTRSKQAVVQERSQLQELGKNFQGALDRVVDYLTSKLPPEPDPQLAYTDPQRHYQMQVLYNAALAEMQGILGMKQGAEEASNLLSETDFKARMSAENENLIKKMPHLKDQKRLEAFNRKVTEGAKAYGFTDDEINVTADHRIRQMAYDAAYGREARANAQRAKAKVQAAPVLPQQRAQHPNSVAALERNNAMRSLQKTGTIEDAMKVLMS